jgi:AcrR family transcriptional regulator
MRKGDARRQEILHAAEKLFFMKGYENTSVQDVLLEAGISKGGFYHHFESKTELLEEIGLARTVEGYERAEKAVNECGGDAVQKLNLLFDVGGFFEAGDPDYLNLMIRVIYQDGCVQLREMIKKLRVTMYEPLLTRVVHEGVEKKLFYTAYPDNVARLILLMDNALTDELAGALPGGAATPEGIGGLMELLSAYRNGVERLLDAPYGSLRLLGLERIAEVAESLGQVPHLHQASES